MHDEKLLKSEEFIRTVLENATYNEACVFALERLKHALKYGHTLEDQDRIRMCIHDAMDLLHNVIRKKIG